MKKIVIQNTLIYFSIFFVFLLPPDALSLLGYNINNPNSFVLLKFHPAFYLFVVGVGLLYLYKSCNLHINKEYIIPLCVFLFMLVYQAAVLHQPIAQVVTTWLVPILVLIFIDLLDYNQKKTLSNLVLIALFFVFIASILEKSGGFLIFPRTSIDGFSLSGGTGQFRSKSFFEHSLIASLCAYTVIATICANNIKKEIRLLELSLMLLALLALVSFGGRFSLIFSLVTIAFFVLFKIMRSMKHGVSGRFRVALSMTLFFSALVFVVYIYFSGFVDDTLSRFEDDKGSAETRMIALNIFLETPVSELILGDRSNTLSDRLFFHGSPFGVEVSWLGIILRQGFIFFACAMIIILFIFLKMKNNLKVNVSYPYFLSLLALTSGTGMASKTLVLVQVIMIMFSLTYNDHEHTHCS